MACVCSVVSNYTVLFLPATLFSILVMPKLYVYVFLFVLFLLRILIILNVSARKPWHAKNGLHTLPEQLSLRRKIAESPGLSTRAQRLIFLGIHQFRMLRTPFHGPV